MTARAVALAAPRNPELMEDSASSFSVPIPTYQSPDLSVYAAPRLRDRRRPQPGHSHYQATLLQDLRPRRIAAPRQRPPFDANSALRDTVHFSELRPCGEWLCPLEPPSLSAETPSAECPLCLVILDPRALLSCHGCRVGVCGLCHLRVLHATGPWFTSRTSPACAFCRRPYERPQLIQLYRLNQAHIQQLPFRFYLEHTPGHVNSAFVDDNYSNATSQDVWVGDVMDDDDVPVLWPSASHFAAPELNALRAPPEPVPVYLRHDARSLVGGLWARCRRFPVASASARPETPSTGPDIDDSNEPCIITIP